MKHLKEFDKFMNEEDDKQQKIPFGKQSFTREEVIRIIEDVYAETAAQNDAAEGRSEQLKAFADYAQKRMWEDGDKDLSEFVDEFLSL